MHQSSFLKWVSQDDSRLRFSFPDGEIERALFLGDVTDRSVRAWIRNPEGSDRVTLRVEGREEISRAVATSAQRDYVAAEVLEMDAPAPGAAFTVEGAGQARFGRFAPLEGAPAPFSFAFGSCHEPFEEDAPAGVLERNASAGIYPALRRHLEATGAGFMLLIGDQIYSDAVSSASVRELLSIDDRVTDDELVATYRHLYRGYFNERGFRGVMEAVPAYLTWDDHDIYDGAGSLLHPTEFDNRLRGAAAVAYREYQSLRNPGGSLDAAPPYSYSFWYADTGFHVLDLRGSREFKEARILGDEGWRRLEAFLDEASAREVKSVFIAASVPVIHGSPLLMSMLERWPTAEGKDVRDRWAVPTFRVERDAFLDRLFTWQASERRRQVFLLSGDVHVAAAFHVARERGPGRIRQWTSSALSTATGIEHVVANRVLTSLVRLGERGVHIEGRGLVPTNNAAIVEVRPADGGGHDVTFRVYGYDERAQSLNLALTDVSAAAARRP